MSHPFLSPEWIDAMRDLRTRHSAIDPVVAVVVRCNLVVTDVPFGEGTVHSHLDTSTGAVVMELGHLDAPDVTVTTDYATARTLFIERDPQRAMEALFQGRVRVEGEVIKLMALQTMTPPPGAESIADEIRSLTN